MLHPITKMELIGPDLTKLASVLFNNRFTLRFCASEHWNTQHQAWNFCFYVYLILFVMYNSMVIIFELVNWQPSLVSQFNWIMQLRKGTKNSNSCDLLSFFMRSPLLKSSLPKSFQIEVLDKNHESKVEEKADEEVEEEKEEDEV